MQHNSLCPSYEAIKTASAGSPSAARKARAGDGLAGQVPASWRRGAADGGREGAAAILRRCSWAAGCARGRRRAGFRGPGSR